MKPQKVGDETIENKTGATPVTEENGVDKKAKKVDTTIGGSLGEATQHIEDAIACINKGTGASNMSKHHMQAIAKLKTAQVLIRVG